MKFLLIATLALLVGCGKKETFKVVNGKDGKDGANGHSLVSEVSEAGELCSTGGNVLSIYLDMDDNLELNPEIDKFQVSMVTCNGLIGAAGQDGTNGSDGRDGVDGLRGEQGEQGLTGPRGPRGQRGPRGLQGIAGRNGRDGEDGATGATGPSGPQGSQGIQGIAGASGIQGAAGAAGTGATITSYTSDSCTAVSNTGYYVKPNGSNVGVYSASSCSNGSNKEELNDGESFWFSSTQLGVVINSGGIRVIKFN